MGLTSKEGTHFRFYQVYYLGLSFKNLLSTLFTFEFVVYQYRLKTKQRPNLWKPYSIRIIRKYC